MSLLSWLGNQESRKGEKRKDWKKQETNLGSLICCKLLVKYACFLHLIRIKFGVFVMRDCYDPDNTANKNSRPTACKLDSRHTLQQVIRITS